MPISVSKLATVASVLTLSCALALPVPARAANLDHAAVAMGAPTVLGIEKSSDADEQAAFDLTEALRTEMGKRDKGGGADLSLLELRLTMGCDGNDPTCLAEGGKTIDADELIYGSVVSDGDNYQVSVERLDVGAAKVVGQTARPVPKSRFADADELRGLAKELVDEVYGLAEPPPAPTPPTPPGLQDEPADETPAEGPAEEPTEDAADVEASSSDLIWGRDPNPPTWKWVGLGVSAGLAAASLGTAIGTTIAVSPNGSVRRDLNDAADESLQDSSPSNDVDRRAVDDVCKAAREEINPVAEPGAVRNASITEICNRGDALATSATVTWITSGVFLASTAVFTTLLFVRKKDSATARKMIEHGVSVGGAPTPDGGLLVGGRMRF